MSAQQLHAGMYGPSPADPLYYGMAMYGAAAVEGAPIYTEAAYEMAGPGGPIYGPEVTHDCVVVVFYSWNFGGGRLIRIFWKKYNT